jgi:N-acetyl-alpha-D-glucosaminyl L-malate synthase BshA
MKIGIICYPTYGGSGVVATELGCALANRDHEVHIFSTGRPFKLPDFKEKVIFHEVPVVHYPLFEHTPYTLTLASTLYEAVQVHGLDVIHAHYAIPHAAAAYMAKQMVNNGLPIITTLHGTDITLVGSHAAYAPVVKFTIDKSDGVTAVSHYLANDTRTRFGVQRDIQVIYNFVNGDEYNRNQCRIPKSLFAPGGVPLIVHMSNFRPVKRVVDLIQAFIKVRKTTECRMLLVGDGPDRWPAEMAARDGGVLSDVVFLGKQPAIVDLLSLADVYCMPSGDESFGLSALEAMACEVPIVATRVGGVPEVVVDGECGFLVPIGDTDQMAERILQLIADKELARRMGLAGRERALSVFPEEKIVSQYESLYRSVTSQ